MTKVSVITVKKAVEQQKKPKLTRREPSRDRQIKKLRTVWKPWFGILLRSLSWTGYLRDTYVQPFSDNEADEKRNLFSYGFDIRAGTFIVEPWLARTNGSLGLAGFRENAETYDSQNINIVGDIRLKIFPQSPFPFEGFFGVGMSDTVFGEYLSNSTSTRYGFFQRYSRVGGAFYFLSYDKQITDFKQSDENLKRVDQDEVIYSEFDNIEVSASKSLDKHQFRFQGTNNTSSNSGLSDSTVDYTRIIVDHSYDPWRELSVDNLLTFARLETSTRASSFGDTRIVTDVGRDDIQFINTTFWVPEKRRWRANFGARYFVIVDTTKASLREEELSSSDVESSTANLNGGLNYDFDKNLRGNVNINVDRTASGPRSFVSSNQNAGLTYSSDPVTLMTATYTWQYGASLYNLMGETSSVLRTNTQITHGIIKDYQLFESSSLELSISQGYSIDHNISGTSQNIALPIEGRIPASQDRLTHTASASFGTKGKAIRSNFRVTVSDSRDRGIMFSQGGTAFKAFSVYAVFDMRISKYSMVASGFSSRKNLSNVNKERKYNSTVSSNGNLMYRHNRFLGLRGARFVSRMDVSDDKGIPSFGEEGSRSSFSWENKLNYSIGRLELAAELRMYRVTGDTRNLLMLRVVRSFGR